MKRCFSITFTLLVFCMLLFTAAACGFFGKSEEEEVQNEDAEETVEESVPNYNIAVILPDEEGHKWQRSGRYIMETLENWGYGAELYYAESSAARQAEIINASIAEEADCIILAAVDSYSDEIREAVESAAKNSIPVVAYDRMVMNTTATDIYVDYDPYLSGRMAGQYLEGKLGLDGSNNIEIYMAGEEDSSARYFYSGAMDVLKPHIDEGRLNVPSGLKSFEQTAIGFSDTQKARNAAETALISYYTQDRQLDAVLAADDAVALGVTEAILGAGYGQSFPFITGSGCHRENMLNLIDGYQSVSIFTDERVLAEKASEAADWLVHNMTFQGADVITYHNGKKIVPAILVEPVMVDGENYKTLLIGGDYYSYTDLNPE